jgi:hypothetical protein
MFMKKILFGWSRLWLLLAVELAAAQAHAAQITLGFTDDFDPAYWSLKPDVLVTPGTVSFNNANTELLLTGPSGLAASQNGVMEEADYLGPGGGGAPSAGTVTFNWSFNSRVTVYATASIGTTSGDYTLASGGPGTPEEGTYSFSLSLGEQFAFLLSTDNLAGKNSPAELSITDFSFTPVPEASTIWDRVGLLALLAMSEAARRSRPKPPLGGHCH